MYSNGDSEKIVGKAIKQLNLPREELVIMTKVSCISTSPSFSFNNHARQLCLPVPSDPGLNIVATGKNPQDVGIINQLGLNRKVCLVDPLVPRTLADRCVFLPQHIFDSVKASLKRLQLDYIDVLQCTWLCYMRSLWSLTFRSRPSIRLHHSNRGDGILRSGGISESL